MCGLRAGGTLHTGITLREEHNTEKGLKNTATTIPTPQNTTQHLIRSQPTPTHTPGPPFSTHTPKTFHKLALQGNILHPAVDTEPQETPLTVFPRKIPNYTPTGRYQHTHWGARAPKQRVRPTHHPARHKRPTNPETDRPGLFPLQPPEPCPN
jgi:hypothetical protein